MPRWWGSGDPDFAPAPLPADRDGSAFAVVNGKLWVLGGWNAGYLATTATAYSYDIHANTWSTGTPVSFSFEAYCRGVAVDNDLYFLTPDGNLHRYNTASGVTATVGASGVTGYHDLALIGGFIYAGLATTTPRRYEIASGLWTNAPGASPYTETHDYAAVVEFEGLIYVLGGSGGLGRVATARRYDPTYGLWSVLPDLPEAVTWHNAVVMRGQIVVLGGETAGGNALVWQLSPSGSTWETPYPANPLPTAGAAAGVVFDRIISVGGYGYTAEDAIAGSQMLGTSFATLDATADIESYMDDIPAYLHLSADVEGGPGVVARVTAWALIGSLYEAASLVVEADILAAEDIDPVAPGVDHGAEAGTPGAEDYGVGSTGTLDTLERSPGAYLTYGLSHGIGNGVEGSISALGRDAPSGYPGYWPFLRLEPEQGYGWERGGDVTTTVTASGRQEERALSAIEGGPDGLLPELMPVDGLNSLPGALNPPPCFYPAEAELCTVASFEMACEHKQEIEDMTQEMLPTRLQLARAAAAHAGITLSVLTGAGLWDIHEKVDKDYRTEGKTAYDVISDMLMIADPRTWYLPDVMVIDGRALPGGTTEAPAASLTGPAQLWEDAAVQSGSFAVQVNHDEAGPGGSAPGAPPLPAPKLSDYLKKCDEEVDGCDGRTFETMEDGELSWTEEAAPWRIEHYMRKAGGQIVEERRDKFIEMPTFEGSGQSFRPAGWVSHHVETMRTVHSYYSCCRNALRSSVEETHVIELWGLSTYWRLDARKATRQRYHAEGWLMTSTSDSLEFDGHVEIPIGNGGLIRRATYKSSSRSDRWTPVGGGIWACNISTTAREPRPIYEDVEEEVPVEGSDPPATETVTTREVVGIFYATVTNNYTQMTDGGPPTVSCDDVDPCNPDETCEERAGREHAEAMVEHDKQLAINAASAVNRPWRTGRHSFTIEQAWKAPAVGDVITTSRGPARVMRVGWSGGTPHSGSPGDQVTVEAWSQIA